VLLFEIFETENFIFMNRDILGSLFRQKLYNWKSAKVLA